MVIGERPDGHAEHGDYELDPEPVAEKSPLSRNAVPAAEPQHDREQDVVDADEDGGREPGRPARSGASPSWPDRIDNDPGRETAERVVREVERLDVPRVAVADRERDVQGDDECDDE